MTIETRDAFDGMLGPEASIDDLAKFDFGLAHALTGPLRIEGAEPGDLLAIEIIEYESAPTGITMSGGAGPLGDLFTEPFLVHWELSSGYARSTALPGVSIPGAPFAGIMGVAPSAETLALMRSRELDLAARGGRIADDAPDYACPPLARSGLRTIPPRETGGNMDIRQLVAGAVLYLPVEVSGALFSTGDLHFAQGDGEVCGCGIEMAGAVTVSFDVLKTPRWRPRFPCFRTPAAPERAYFATTGIPINDDGSNGDMDVSLAARRALEEMVDYLEEVRGLDRHAAYVLCSVAVDLRISEAVDFPNPLVSALLPLDIFEDATDQIHRLPATA